MLSRSLSAVARAAVRGETVRQGVRCFSAVEIQTAKKQNALDKVYDDMTTIRSAYLESADFKLFVDTPGIKPEQKAAALTAVAKGFSPLSQNFLQLLVENKRIDLVKRMVDEFEKSFQEEKGIVVCKVQTAAQISDKQKKSIVSAMQARAEKGKQLQFEYDVSPALVGGFVVKMGEQVLDFSVQSRLERLQTSLLQPVE